MRVAVWVVRWSKDWGVGGSGGSKFGIGGEVIGMNGVRRRISAGMRCV